MELRLFVSRAADCDQPCCLSFSLDTFAARTLMPAGMQVLKEDLSSSFVSSSSPKASCFPFGVTSLSPPPLPPAVCENCMEVDLTAVAIIIVIDVCITLGLLMVVYYWSKNRKAKAKPVTRGTGAAGRPRGKAIELGQGRLGLEPGWPSLQQIPNSFSSTFSVIPRSLQRAPDSRSLLPSTLKKKKNSKNQR